MVAKLQNYQERIIGDIWGGSCVECDSLLKPKLHIYCLKNEEVAVLTCPSCDFTIIVVEVEKLKNHCVKEDQSNKTLVLTHI